MSEQDDIFEKAERHFTALDCDRDSGLLFADIVRDSEMKNFLEQNLTEQTVIDIGCGEKPYYGWKISEFPILGYIGIDPYLIPDQSRHEKVKYKLGNPLKILAERDPESAICMVNNIDSVVLAVRSFNGLPNEVVDYVNELNRLIHRVTPREGIFIASRYLGTSNSNGLQDIQSFGFKVERENCGYKLMRKQ